MQIEYLSLTYPNLFCQVAFQHICKMSDQFYEAKGQAENLPRSVTKEEKSKLYGLYKQATEGDCSEGASSAACKHLLPSSTSTPVHNHANKPKCAFVHSIHILMFRLYAFPCLSWDALLRYVTRRNLVVASLSDLPTPNLSTSQERILGTN